MSWRFLVSGFCSVFFLVVFFFRVFSAALVGKWNVERKWAPHRPTELDFGVHRILSGNIGNRLDIHINDRMVLTLADRAFHMAKSPNVPPDRRPDGCRKGPPPLAWFWLLSAAAASAVGILLCTRAFCLQGFAAIHMECRAT